MTGFELLGVANIIVTSGVLVLVARVAYLAGRWTQRVDSLEQKMDKLMRACPYCKPGARTEG